MNAESSNISPTTYTPTGADQAYLPILPSSPYSTLPVRGPAVPASVPARLEVNPDTPTSAATAHSAQHPVVVSPVTPSTFGLGLGLGLGSGGPFGIAASPSYNIVTTPNLTALPPVPRSRGARLRNKVLSMLGLKGQKEGDESGKGKSTGSTAKSMNMKRWPLWSGKQGARKRRPTGDKLKASISEPTLFQRGGFNNADIPSTSTEYYQRLGQTGPMMRSAVQLESRETDDFGSSFGGNCSGSLSGRYDDRPKTRRGIRDDGALYDNIQTSGGNKDVAEDDEDHGNDFENYDTEDEYSRLHEQGTGRTHHRVAHFTGDDEGQDHQEEDLIANSNFQQSTTTPPNHNVAPLPSALSLGSGFEFGFDIPHDRFTAEGEEAGGAEEGGAEAGEAEEAAAPADTPIPEIRVRPASEELKAVAEEGVEGVEGVEPAGTAEAARPLPAQIEDWRVVANGLAMHPNVMEFTERPKGK